jgi:hypothetical protein
MEFGVKRKSEYQAAVASLLALVEAADKPFRESIATLERMGKLRFKSPANERNCTASIRQAVSALTPVIEQFKGAANAVAARYREMGELAAAAAEED